MTEQVKAHGTSTSMVKPALAEPDAGTDMSLRVKVSCPSSCSLHGGTVRIVDDEGRTVREVELADFDGTANETDKFAVTAPVRPGEYTWTAVFPAQEKEGISHEQSSAAFSFAVKPHATRVEVWDVPSPVTSSEEFRIKVGVKCSAGCSVTGQKIEIYDHEGARVASATLGEVPRSGGDELSCAQVVLEAPGEERHYRWTAKFLKPGLELAHEEASCTFAFGTVGQPEHVVTIEVVDKDTKTPARCARVVLRPRAYRGAAHSMQTDDSGVARVSVAKGDYQLYVSTEEYEKLVPTITVGSDLTIRAELSDALDSWRGLAHQSTA